MLPTATDADERDANLDYSLWDRDDPIVNGDRDDAGFGNDDAESFDFRQMFDYQNGELKVNLILKTDDAFDFETKQVYEFRLVACDNEYNRAYIDITVRIDDVNEPPDAPDAPMVEGASTTKLVVRWTAPDNAGRPDITDYDLQYRKDGTNDNWRSWSHSGTGTNAIISSGLDPDTAYEVQVLARNPEGSSGWSPSGVGSTRASGENRPPVFLEGSSTTRSFAENVGRNTAPVRNAGGPVRATGEGTLTYSLEGADAASFDIVGTSGQIRTRAGEIYDHEAKPVFYRVTVRAVDQNGNNATIAVDIEITDVLEPPLRPAAPVVSTDPDSAMNLLVSWTAPDNLGRPAITSYDLQYRRGTSGSWTDGPQDEPGTSTTLTGLNEGTPYQVQVRATNDEGDGLYSPPGSGQTNVAENDLPMFQTASTTRSFAENTPAGEPVGAPVTASDPGDTLAYSLEGPDASSFRIVRASGQIETRSGVTYDFEAGDAYAVTVKATDSHHTSATIAVDIDITDVDEPPDAPSRPTVSSESIASLSVSWNPPAARPDRPPVTSYDLRYRPCPQGQCPAEPEMDWRNGPQNVMDTNTVISELSDGTRYQVQVLARSDEGAGDWSRSGLGRTLAVPKFADATAMRSVAENTPPGRNVGTAIRATDADNDPLTYTLGGMDAASFDIVATSGQIRTKPGVTYDHEAESSYDVTVRASDPDMNSATIDVDIEIADVLEPPLRPAAPVVSTDPDSAMSLLVSWTAPDNPSRPPITGYDLQYRRGTSGSWTDGPQDVSGTSTTLTGLNGGTQYQVQVRATNDEGDGPWSPPGSGQTNVAGNDLPVFQTASTTRSFAENTPAGEPVGLPVAASDPGDTLAYSLEGPDASSFRIVRASGQIETRSGVAYDFEARDAYAVTVKATDSHNTSATIAVDIDITDVDEPPDAPSRPTVAGHSITSLLVGWRPPAARPDRPPIDRYNLQYLACMDGQCEPNPQDADWSNGPQGVDDTSAVIPGLDENTRYQVRVQAANEEGSGDWSQPGAGRTLAAPEFADATATRSVAENTPAGRNVGAVITGDGCG